MPNLDNMRFLTDHIHWLGIFKKNFERRNLFMKKSVLVFDKCSENIYHAVFRNNHSRKIYMKISCAANEINILKYFYVDRPRSGEPTVPKRLTTKSCTLDELYDVIANELDKKFSSIEFSDVICNLSDEDYIASELSSNGKYKFLILVRYGDRMCTRLKNRVYRKIYFEVKVDGNKGLVKKCYYYDRCYKRTDLFITPTGLNTIFFDFSYDNILKIVNDELNCDFTHVIVTDDIFGFYESDNPVSI